MQKPELQSLGQASLVSIQGEPLFKSNGIQQQ